MEAEMENQPDFGQLEQSLLIAGTQLSRLPNMPIFDLAVQIRDLRNEMREDNRQLREDNRQLRDDMNRNHLQLVEMFLRSEINNLARIKNAKIYEATALVEPLRDVHNRPIPGFPRTPRDITGLGDGQINQLLGALGLPIEGTLDNKKDRFRSYIGLSIVA